MGRNTRNRRHNYFRYVFKHATKNEKQKKLKEAILKGEIFVDS